MFITFTRDRGTEHQHGFTLTEVAIVLGVVGVILGAIWVASSYVNEANRTQKAQTQVLQIVAGYRSILGPRGVVDPDWTDITTVGMNGGLFPDDMIVSGRTTPINPWGGTTQVLTHKTLQGIAVYYNGLPQKACVSLAVTLVSLPDVLWENIAGVTATSPPLTNAQIATACSAASGNYVRVMFKAR